jgi:hypothetical protein
VFVPTYIQTQDFQKVNQKVCLWARHSAAWSCRVCGCMHHIATEFEENWEAVPN